MMKSRTLGDEIAYLQEQIAKQEDSEEPNRKEIIRLRGKLRRASDRRYVFDYTNSYNWVVLAVGLFACWLCLHAIAR